MDSKPTNLKDQIAVNKLPLHLVPTTLPAYAAVAFAEGASKYGAYNWRAAGVRASVYKSALERHLGKWWNGEWADPKTSVPHLASVIACAGIILDALECDKLTDDRPLPMDLDSVICELEESVKNVFELNKDKNPKHWTINDQGYEGRSP